MYFIFVENGKITGCGQTQAIGEGTINISVTEEIYNDYLENPEKYIYSNGEIVINPDYEQQQAEKREEQFKKDFFETSLGWIRRKVSMKTGETKDFLTDLIPVISLAVSQGKAANIITYKEPDFTKDITDWTALQEVKQATPQFIQECLNQVSTDFTGL